MVAVQRSVIVVATAAIVGLTILFAFWTPEILPTTVETVLHTLNSQSHRTRRLHYLLPATASTLNFCRTILSGAITGYPEPILIGWAGHGKYDGAKSHLFKISETLAYLRALPRDNDDDIVLLVSANCFRSTENKY
jgi:hypothetical protein